MKSISKKWDKYFKLKDNQRTRLLKKIKDNNDMIFEIHNKYFSGHNYEDPMYRFYHFSFKVFHMQDAISKFMTLARKIHPKRKKEFHSMFNEIILDAQSQGSFQLKYNDDFGEHAKPIVEAYCHCKYFMDMFLESLKMENEPESFITSGWAAILELYQLR